GVEAVSIGALTGERVAVRRTDDAARRVQTAVDLRRYRARDIAGRLVSIQVAFEGDDLAGMLEAERQAQADREPVPGLGESDALPVSHVNLVRVDVEAHV